LTKFNVGPRYIIQSKSVGFFGAPYMQADGHHGIKTWF